jgi:hypothetical protein
MVCRFTPEQFDPATRWRGDEVMTPGAYIAAPDPESTPCRESTPQLNTEKQADNSSLRRRQEMTPHNTAAAPQSTP